MVNFYRVRAQGITGQDLTDLYKTKRGSNPLSLLFERAKSGCCRITERIWAEGAADKLLTFETAVSAFPHLLFANAAIINRDGRRTLRSHVQAGRFRPDRYRSQGE